MRGSGLKLFIAVACRRVSKRRITTAQREARRQTSYLSMKPPVLLLIFASSAAAAAPPVGRDVDIISSDGTGLKATYSTAARPGPAVLLMHMCNTTRTPWESVVS